MQTSTLIEVLTKHKELFGIATGSLGIVKTLWSFAEARSAESRRDKLLRQIRVLGLAVRELRDENLLTTQHSNTAKDEMGLEVSRTFGELVKILQRIRENRAEREGLGIGQRLFLIYKPPNWRAWIAHVLCWLSAITFVFYMLGVSVSDETGDFSFAVFKEAWTNSTTYGGLLFVLGIFLLARLWARLELRMSREKITSGRFAVGAIGKILAWSYGLGGLALAIFAITVGIDDLPGGLKWAALGLVMMLCAVPLNAWARARQGKPPGRSWKAKAALFAPSVSLALVVVLNLGGVVLATFSGDIVAYWEAWFHEPVVPFIILPIALIPLFAAFRAVIYGDVHEAEVLNPARPSA